MTDSAVHTEIDRLINSLDGELISHSRAVDALLDVRTVAANTNLVALIDDALRSMPGKNAAPTEWLHRQLSYVSAMHEVNLALDTPILHAT